MGFYEQAFGATVEHRESVERDGVDEALLVEADGGVEVVNGDGDMVDFGEDHVGNRIWPPPPAPNCPPPIRYQTAPAALSWTIASSS
ncbi:MAG: hypothetical protein AAFN30_21075 [Actinomycetota bacterium]